jgi:hypothetical protein
MEHPGREKPVSYQAQLTRRPGKIEGRTTVHSLAIRGDVSKIHFEDIGFRVARTPIDPLGRLHSEVSATSFQSI